MEVVGEELTRGRIGLWLADGGNTEAGGGERIRHRVQRHERVVQEPRPDYFALVLPWMFLAITPPGSRGLGSPAPPTLFTPTFQ